MGLSSTHLSIGAGTMSSASPALSDPPDVDGIADRVRGFVSEFFYVTDPAALADDRSLIEAGIVDSTGMMDVIVFLETEFGFHVDDDDMVPENLETIGLITEFVARKTARRTGEIHDPDAAASIA
jgi:acyl carrier protein